MREHQGERRARRLDFIGTNTLSNTEDWCDVPHGEAGGYCALVGVASASNRRSFSVRGRRVASARIEHEGGLYLQHHMDVQHSTVCHPDSEKRRSRWWM